MVESEDLRFGEVVSILFFSLLFCSSFLVFNTAFVRDGGASPCFNTRGDECEERAAAFCASKGFEDSEVLPDLNRENRRYAMVSCIGERVPPKWEVQRLNVSGDFLNLPVGGTLNGLDKILAGLVSLFLATLVTGMLASLFGMLDGGRV